MTDSRKLKAVFVVVSVLLFSFMVSTSKGEGLIYVYYVETDRETYEIGQNVNVVAAWHIYYDNPVEYSEATLSCMRGLSPLSSETWLNESEGYHVHQTRFLLNPSDWNPGEMSENGTAQAKLSLQPEGGYIIQRRSFIVTRAGQNCTLVNLAPAEPVANVSVISVGLRVFNRNNSSFGVGLNGIYFNVTNPEGFLLVTNGSCITDPNGYFEISFNPSFVYGAYVLSFKSVANERYFEKRFNCTVNVDRSSIPTNLEVECSYVGNKYNSTTSYALEPARITVKLASALDGTGIKGQLLNLRMLDALDLLTVWQTEETTNTSGYATCTFTMPHEGRFILNVSYDGLSNVWCSSSKTLSTPITAKARGLSIIDLYGLPSIVTSNQTYAAKYLVVDALTGDPVRDSEVKVEINTVLLALGVTNEDGAIEFNLRFPDGDDVPANNITMLVEASYLPISGIYSNASLSVPVFYKIPTIIRLKTSLQGVREDGETLLVQAELLSSDLTPLADQNVKFIILRNSGSIPREVLTRTTDSKGTSTISIRLETGVITILATFDGNTTLGAANCTCSLSVWPGFQERISSSLADIASTCILSVISVLAIAKFRRRVRWQDIPAG